MLSGVKSLELVRLLYLLMGVVDDGLPSNSRKSVPQPISYVAAGVEPMDIGDRSIVEGRYKLRPKIAYGV